MEMSVQEVQIRKECREEGYKKGRAEGKVEGKVEGRMEIMAALLKMERLVAWEIAESTGVPEEIVVKFGELIWPAD